MNSLDEIIGAILDEYAIQGTVKSKSERDKPSWAVVNDDQLTFRINFSENYLAHCISVDNRKCFNKDSQCPIHFTLDLSRRKKERLNQALKHLRTKQGERDSATFSFVGFDEFGHHVRDEFYHNS